MPSFLENVVVVAFFLTANVTDPRHDGQSELVSLLFMTTLTIEGNAVNAWPRLALPGATLLPYFIKMGLPNRLL